MAKTASRPSGATKPAKSTKSPEPSKSAKSPKAAGKTKNQLPAKPSKAKKTSKLGKFFRKIGAPFAKVFRPIGKALTKIFRPIGRFFAKIFAPIGRFFAKVFRPLVKAAKKRVAKIKKYRSERVILHRSFRRSYREDYVRQTKTPGLLNHAASTFRIIRKHWKTFLPFIIVMVALYIFLVGLMSEDFYRQFQDSIDQTSEDLAEGRVGNFGKAALLLLSTVTSGGLESGRDEAQTMFMIVLFLVMWLVTIFLMRHYQIGSRPKLRDALYNALAPLISTLLIFAVVFIQAVPLMLVAITYSAAVTTGFLATPFYALLYFIFAAVMLLLSAYMLSSSLMALVAVTTPGVYPMTALGAASDLMAGRRTRLIIRILYLVVVVALIYIVVMIPVILLDLWLKGMWEWIAEWPIVPFILLATTCFIFIYATVYLYQYYRWLLEYQEK